MANTLNGLPRPWNIKELKSRGEITEAQETSLLDFIFEKMADNGRSAANNCPRCEQSGIDPQSLDTDGNQINCTMVDSNNPNNKCDGWGFTTIKVNKVITGEIYTSATP